MSIINRDMFLISTVIVDLSFSALDAMRKAYEEELQCERAKYRECMATMYNEDFVNEIRRRHELVL